MGKKELRMGQCQHRFMTPVSDVKWMLIPQEGSLLEVTSQSLGYSPTKWGCTNHLKSLPWAFRLMLFQKKDMPPLSSQRVTGFPSTTTVWTSSLSSTITSLDWIRTPKTFPKWSEKTWNHYIISGMYGLSLFLHAISYHWLIYTLEKEQNRFNDTAFDRCRWPCSLDTWKNDCASSVSQGQICHGECKLQRYSR